MKKQIYIIFLFLLIVRFPFGNEIFEEKIEYLKPELHLSKEQISKLDILFKKVNLEKKQTAKISSKKERLETALELNTNFQNKLKKILTKDQYTAYQHKKAELLTKRDVKELQQELSLTKKQTSVIFDIVKKTNLIFEDYKSENNIDTLLDKLAYLNKIRKTFKTMNNAILENLNDNQKIKYKEIVKEKRKAV